MCEETRRNDCDCLRDLINTIIRLQTFDDVCCDGFGCDKPFLGPTPTFVCYNTRPVNFYTCCNGTLWTLPYTFNGTTGTSSIFRIEGIEGDCVTCRILIPSETPTDISPYTATNSFFTINLRCIGAIKCLPDAYVPCNTAV